MVKRKQKENDQEADHSLPIPIQIFLWRQSSPFIKKKFDKVIEATALSCERVIVLNILHGLSPSLSDAISSIPRWNFVKASLPHIMHACAAIIEKCRVEQKNVKFDKFENKLLYALHWILLDAANECVTDEHYNKEHLLHPISTIQLFVYLFAPLIPLMNESDFEDLRLHHALKLWQTLWQHKQPDVLVFSKLVKPNSHLSLIAAQRNKNRISSGAYGNRLSTVTPRREVVSCNAEVPVLKNCLVPSEGDVDSFMAPLAHMSSVCEGGGIGTDSRNADQSLHVHEIFCKGCNSPVQIDQPFCLSCGRPIGSFDPLLSPSFNAEYNVKLRQKYRTESRYDARCASYLDVAVVRALFSPCWSSDGYLWCLEFLSRRMSEIADEILQQPYFKLKSSSYPRLIFPEVLDEEEELDANQSALIDKGDKSLALLKLPYSLSSRWKLIRFYRQISKTRYIDEENDWLSFDRDSSLISDRASKIIHMLLSKKVVSPQSNYLQEETKISVAPKKSSSPSGAMFTLTSSELRRSESKQFLSASDSNVNYNSLKEVEEAPGSSAYITSEGFLSYGPILVGMHAVVCKENSIKGFEAVMNMLEILITIGSFTQSNGTYDEIVALEYVSGQNEESFFVALDICIRILKYLGCLICSTTKSLQLEQLRAKVKLTFSRLRNVCTPKFEKYLREFVTQGQLKFVMDAVHALIGFCASFPLPTYVPLRNYFPMLHFSPAETNEPVGIVTIMLSIIFEPLVIRLSESMDYLLRSENMSLYDDVRIFLHHVQENYKTIFYTTAYSALLKPLRKFKRDQKKLAKKDGICTKKMNTEEEEKLKVCADSEVLSSVSSENTDKKLNAEAIGSAPTGSTLSDSVASMPVNLEQVKMRKHSVATSSNRTSFHLDSVKGGTSSSVANGSVTVETMKDEDINDRFLDTESICKELRLVRFLMKSCPQTCPPDPQFLSVIFEIEAPVISKAGFLLECINFVHKCYLGKWPSGVPKTNVGQRCISINKLKPNEQCTSRLFVFWAEAMTSQLNSILQKEASSDDKDLYWGLSHSINDYYDEGLLKTLSCPYGLRMLAALLLLEITIFIRENFQVYPRRLLLKRDFAEKLKSRRLHGSIVSQQSFKSEGSLIENESLPDRRISSSFNEKDNSFSSNGYVIPSDTADDAGKEVRFRDKSCRHQSSMLLKQPPGLSARRPTICRQSSKRESAHSENIETLSPSPAESTADDDDLSKNMEDFDDKKLVSWLEPVIGLLLSTNIACDHINCSYNCFDKQNQSCWQLIQAVFQLPLVKRRSTSETDEFMRSVIDRQNKRISSLLSYYSIYGVTSMLKKKGPTPKSDGSLPLHYSSFVFSKRFQAQTLAHVPFIMLCKNSSFLDENKFLEVLFVTWELLLDSNAELSSTTATLFILAASKVPGLVEQLLLREYENESAKVRYEAVLRFQVLWNKRYQFWLQVEPGAQAHYKILPPAIDFAMPSPLIGIPFNQIVDPPWIPLSKSRVEEVAVSQDEVRTVVTAGKTRKKHQQENLHKALQKEDSARRVAREMFLASNVSLLQSASIEPFLRTTKPTGVADDENDGNEDEHVTEGIQIAQVAFPVGLSKAVVALVDLLEDDDVALENGCTVSELAKTVVWNCLVEDPSLFSRFFMEKITHKDRLKRSIQTMRKLFLFMTTFPPQAAHIFFNCLLGLVMNFIRSPSESSNEFIYVSLSLLWMTVPYVNSVSWKDLKQLLRKEQCDLSILVSASVPTTKKIIVHGLDLSQIPTQILVQDDMKFSAVLQESSVFFGIPESKRDKCFLFDNKTGQIHIADTYVRDFYFFRRNVYPQLSIQNMNQKEANIKLENMAFSIKLMEIGKVLFARSVLSAVPPHQLKNLASVMRDDLMKCAGFPRKALQSDFGLFSRLQDHELLNLDVAHKLCWLKFICDVMLNSDASSLEVYDISLFINVINGTFILHCENYGLMRFALATYLNFARYFKHIFEMSGYMLIMPTILTVYAALGSNQILCRAIEFICKQFYVLHRTPFLLQLFGSLSALLTNGSQETEKSTLQPASTCKLIFALEGDIKDDCFILQLLANNKVLKSLDFCYDEDDPSFRFLDSISVCVTVVAFAPAMTRSLQVLLILDCTLPYFLEHMKARTDANPTAEAAKKEIKDLETVMVTMKTLITASETLSSRSFVGLKHENLGYRHLNKGSVHSPSIAIDEDSVRLDTDERSKHKTIDDYSNEGIDLRLPRDRILSVVSTYVKWTSERFEDLNKLINDPNFKMPEILDIKSHIRLSDMAQFLLKLSLHDPITLGCKGLQSYFQKLCPVTDWREPAVRSSFLNLLRRVDRTFTKLTKKSFVKKAVNWEAIAGILDGIFLTLEKYPSIAHYSQLKTVVASCILLIINETSSSEVFVSKTDNPNSFPKTFCRAVIKLTGKYLHLLRDAPNLEMMINGTITSGNFSSLNLYLHFLIPLLFWAISNRKDAPSLHKDDIDYILKSTLAILKPHSKLTSAMNVPKQQHLTIGEALLSNTFARKPAKHVKDLLGRTALLTLKIIIVGYANFLQKQWVRLSLSVKMLFARQSPTIPINALLSFVEFIAFTRNPLFLLMKPSLQSMIENLGMEGSADIERLKSLELCLEENSKTKFISRLEAINNLTEELSQIKALLTGDEDTDARKPEDREAIKSMAESALKADRDWHQKRLQRSRHVTRFPTSKKRPEKVQISSIQTLFDAYKRKYNTRCRELGDDYVSSTQDSMTEDSAWNSQDLITFSHVANSTSSTSCPNTPARLHRTPDTHIRNKNRHFSRQDFKINESDSSLDVTPRMTRKSSYRQTHPTPPETKMEKIVENQSQVRFYPDTPTFNDDSIV